MNEQELIAAAKKYRENSYLKGDVDTVKLAELLPFAFSGDDLK